MAKKQAKKKARKKPNKKPAKRAGQRLDKGESLYTDELAEQAKEIIISLQLIKPDGSLHYTNIAKVLKVPSRTFSSWRNAGSQYYKPKFVKALGAARDELMEGLQSGKIKQAMIKRALPYTRIKKTKERMVVGPKMPAMGGMDKRGLQLAAVKLGLQVDDKMTRGVLKVKIAEEIVRQTNEEMVTTRQEEERMHGDVAAAKLVLPHIGPKEKRWVPKLEMEVEGKSLADIAAIMMGRKVG